MKTFKDISTITYCSSDYLISQLNGLYNQGDIEFWAFIPHHAESVDLKDHTHLFITPSCKLETKDLQFRENELVGTMPYEKSNFGHWFFYSVHNDLYLKSHKLEKKYHYSPNDFVSSDFASFMARVQTLEIDEYLDNSTNVLTIIKKAVCDNIPFSNLVTQGYIPINQIKNYHSAYDYIYRDYYDKLNGTTKPF